MVKISSKSDEWIRKIRISVKIRKSGDFRTIFGENPLTLFSWKTFLMEVKIEVEMEIEMEVEMKVEMDAPILQPN